MATKQRRSVITSEQARDWYKEIKPYVSFTVKKSGSLSRAQKEKIYRYYDEISALKIRPHTVYKTRSKSRLAKAQEFSRHDPNLTEIKVAFIPTAEDNSRINFDKTGNMLITGKHISATVLFFDRKMLLKDVNAEVARITGLVPNARRFQIMAGEYLIAGVAYDRKKLVAAVKALMARYPQYVTDKKGKRRRNNHWWKNWMLGLHAFEFRNQRSFASYRKKYGKKSSALKQAAKKATRRVIKKIAAKSIKALAKLEKRVVKSAAVKKRK